MFPNGVYGVALPKRQGKKLLRMLGRKGSRSPAMGLDVNASAEVEIETGVQVLDMSG